MILTPIPNNIKVFTYRQRNGNNFEDAQREAFDMLDKDNSINEVIIIAGDMNFRCIRSFSYYKYTFKIRERIRKRIKSILKIIKYDSK